MAEFPALTLWTDAYLSDTRFLTTLEHGAYLLLLMEAWRRPHCDLPDDDRMLSRMAGLSIDQWNEIKDTILEFWTLDGRSKTWKQKRLSKERDAARIRSRSQRDKAAKRWNKSENNNAAALPKESRGNASTATATAIKEEEEPNGSPSPDASATKQAKPKSRRTIGVDHPLPSDWVPVLTPEAERMVTCWPPGMLEREIANFRDHAATHGRLAKDWQAAFRTWLRKSDERRITNGNRQANGSAATGYRGSGDGRDSFIRSLDETIGGSGPRQPAEAAGRPDLGASQGNLGLAAPGTSAGG